MHILVAKANGRSKARSSSSINHNNYDGGRPSDVRKTKPSSSAATLHTPPKSYPCDDLEDGSVMGVRNLPWSRLNRWISPSPHPTSMSPAQHGSEARAPQNQPK